jgi:hypothetical protein
MSGPLQKVEIYSNFLFPEKISMCLSIGRSGGAVQMGNGWVMGDWFARFIKGKDVFTGMTWKAMNREMPPDQ